MTVYERIKGFFKGEHKFVYVLRDHYESEIWKGIKESAHEGYLEWLQDGKDKNQWVQPLTLAERNLLHKIHDYLYGKDWYVVDPLSDTQVLWIMYNDVRKQVL